MVYIMFMGTYTSGLPIVGTRFISMHLPMEALGIPVVQMTSKWFKEVGLGLIIQVF